MTEGQIFAICVTVVIVVLFLMMGIPDIIDAINRGKRSQNMDIKELLKQQGKELREQYPEAAVISVLGQTKPSPWVLTEEEKKALHDDWGKAQKRQADAIEATRKEILLKKILQKETEDKQQ